mmetsp:Transcript_16887/g.25978  ORF Transcript_16887/g.25978 Transcript_16887/m.25978 type:complete len:132 (-) Transcript_16887:1877-2272(-)
MMDEAPQSHPQANWLSKMMSEEAASNQVQDLSPPFKNIAGSPVDPDRPRRKSDETFQSYISPSKVFGVSTTKGNSCSPIREESPYGRPIRQNSRNLILVIPPKKPVPKRRHLPLGMQKLQQETRLPKKAAR